MNAAVLRTVEENHPCGGYVLAVYESSSKGLSEMGKIFGWAMWDDLDIKKVNKKTVCGTIAYKITAKRNSETTHTYYLCEEEMNEYEFKELKEATRK